MVPDAPKVPQKPAQAEITVHQPLVSLQRGAQRFPQDLPNLMSHLKPSTSPSSFLALPSPSPSKPSSTAPVAIESQSKRHADLLAELGIKVRDFAYESKLPPVQPYRVRQIQPWLRPLKRTRGDEEMDEVSQDNTGTETADGSSSRRSKLKREITEPDITQPRCPHALGSFVNFHQRHPRYAAWLASQSQPQPPNHPQRDDSSKSKPRNSDPYDVTPTVTPNGSLIWPDVVATSDIPALQLDAESQAKDPVTGSQLGTSGPEPEHLDPTGTGLVGPLTPMSSLSSVSSDVPPKPLDSDTSNALSRSPTAFPKEPATPPPSSRYQLRRRPIPPSPQSTKSGLLERKPMYKAAYPLARPVAYSTQSSKHSKAKASLGRVAPTHRTTSKCDETMIVR